MTGDMQVRTTAAGRVVIVLPEWFVAALIIRFAEVSRHPRTAEAFDLIDPFGDGQSEPRQAEALRVVREALGEVAVDMSRLDARDLSDLLRHHAYRIRASESDGVA